MTNLDTMTGVSGDRPPRLVPDLPLPPYSYVSGHFPHPLRDAAGHMAGHVPAPAAPIDPKRWGDSRDYLYAIDLFNHGYYWEAHEAWEGLWHAAGRGQLLGDFLKGLIKLAAGGVKAREGRSEGVARHARRAAELFTITQRRLETAGGGADPLRLLGLDIPELRQWATRVAENPPRLSPTRHVEPVEIVFGFRLVPR